MATGQDGLPGVHVTGGVVEECKLTLGLAPILHHLSEALTVKASLWNEGRATHTNVPVSGVSLLHFQSHRQTVFFFYRPIRSVVISGFHSIRRLLPPG